MKKIIAAMSLSIFAASFAFAADTITLTAKNGNITFPHAKHQKMKFEKGCATCHEKGPGKIAGLGKDWAHKTCKGCHTEMKKGPTKCGECHKK